MTLAWRRLWLHSCCAGSHGPPTATGFEASARKSHCLPYLVPCSGWHTLSRSSGRKHEIGGVFGRRILTEGAITDSLYLAIVGVVCLWLGMRVAARFHWVPRIGVDVSDSPQPVELFANDFHRRKLVKAFVPITAFGMGGRQIVSNFENTVPVVGFAILFRYYLRASSRNSISS